MIPALAAKGLVRFAEIFLPEFKYPTLASLLTTKGGLVFVPGADGTFYALSADTGEKLWSANNGLGHHGGVISYSAKGKQYVAVVTGWGSHVSGNYCPPGIGWN